MTVAEIASETCINARYIVAIEEDQPQILPGDFFHHSFVRQYAHALGLDEAASLKISQAVGPRADIDPIPTFSIPHLIAEIEQQSKPLARVPTRFAAMLLLLVLAGCSGLFALWNESQDALDQDAPISRTVK